MSKPKKKSWKEKQRDRQLKEKNKGKIIVGLIIILFVALGAYVIIQNPVTQFTTIYIRTDGTIDPPTSSVSKISDNQYILLDDISGSIVIEKNNIKLDGANH